jgi:hypothetical protein
VLFHLTKKCAIKFDFLGFFIKLSFIGEYSQIIFLSEKFPHNAKNILFLTLFFC